jgi:hypothetical protein
MMKSSKSRLQVELRRASLAGLPGLASGGTPNAAQNLTKLLLTCLKTAKFSGFFVFLVCFTDSFFGQTQFGFNLTK